jgi:hypothetical protein
MIAIRGRDSSEPGKGACVKPAGPRGKGCVRQARRPEGTTAQAAINQAPRRAYFRLIATKAVPGMLSLVPLSEGKGASFPQ